jgi:DNA modification methylase
VSGFKSDAQRRRVMAQLRTHSGHRSHRVALLSARRGPDARVVLGDFRDKLPTVRGVRTFFTDPPYNYGFNYGPVNDSKPAAEYEALMRHMARSAYEAAAPDANLFIVHYPEELAKLWPALTERWQFRSWLTWCYNGYSGTDKKRWNRSSRSILWLVKGKPSFDGNATLRPFHDAAARQRAQVSGKLGAQLYDWWQVDLVRGASREWCGYANQIPREIIKRCILATTKPGELVADPFAGTASTVKTAATLGRRGWGCDANPDAAPYWGFLRGGLTGVQA